MSLYRILSTEAYAAARRAGEFRGTTDDARDGFIHLSASHQVEGTLARHYPGRSGLVLLTVSEGALETGLLRWEVSRGGARFPHLYGALPMRAVVAVTELPLDGAGNHVIPLIS